MRTMWNEMFWSLVPPPDGTDQCRDDFLVEGSALHLLIYMKERSSKEARDSASKKMNKFRSRHYRSIWGHFPNAVWCINTRRRPKEFKNNRIEVYAYWSGVLPLFPQRTYEAEQNRNSPVPGYMQVSDISMWQKTHECTKRASFVRIQVVAKSIELKTDKGNPEYTKVLKVLCSVWLISGLFWRDSPPKVSLLFTDRKKSKENMVTRGMYF